MISTETAPVGQPTGTAIDTYAIPGHWSLLWRGFRKHRLGMIGLIIFVLMILAVIFVPIISPNPYNRVNPDSSLWAAPIGTVDPSNGHVFLLGSDKIGRDNLALIFQAGRISLTVALIPTLLILIIGFLVGAATGYFGGWLDSIVMRIADFLLGIPILPAYIIVIRLIRDTSTGPHFAEDWGAAFATIIIAFVLFGWMGISRMVRGLVLSLRSQPFIEAAQALGAGAPRIIFRHLLPNTMVPLLVAGMFAVGDFIIMEAMLAYFGLGIRDTLQPTIVTWGNQLTSGQDQVWFMTNLNPFEQIRGYLVLFPSALLLITVLSINFIGEGLRDVLDPRRHS
jgi:peptide/nickel transport system permease protein